MTVKVGINGFGRIGRNLVRAWLENTEFQQQIEIVAVNDLSPLETSLHLLKYDTVAGPLKQELKKASNNILIDDSHIIAYYSERNPEDIHWGAHDVDIVIESTGVFTTSATAGKHEADHVIISAPSEDADYTVVIGVNDEGLDRNSHRIISNASCTTNCLAPIAKTLDETYGIRKGSMTTVHAYTNDQGLLDAPHKDLRRSRAGAANIVPTSTGAAKAIGLVLPQLAGKLDGLALRVPVPNGSIVDLTVQLEHEAKAEHINETLKHASETNLAGILRYTNDPIVSSDILGDTHSSILDSALTWADGDIAKIVAWYDNEYGYSNRLLDLILRLK